MRYDLCSSANSMRKGKSSRLDDFPYQVSKFMWDIIGDHICCLFVDLVFSRFLFESLKSQLWLDEAYS